VNLYKDKERFNMIRKLGMSENHSWEHVSQEYIEMYNLIISQNES